MELWQRQRNEDSTLEPNLWYDRFTQFRLMGPTRSLLGCVNQERVKKGQKQSNYIPGSWRDASKKWNWHKRAEVWDEAQREREQEEYEEERLEWRKRRRRLLQGFFAKLAQALDHFEPERVTLGQLTQAVKTVMEELRAEFDDLPTEKKDIDLKSGGQALSIREVVVEIPGNNEPVANRE